jgi:hypothetical protein
MAPQSAALSAELAERRAKGQDSDPEFRRRCEALRQARWDREAELVMEDYHAACRASDVERALDIRDYMRSIGRDVV